MASLRHIRKRIASVKNTEQITKAMKMMAAVKFRRAQEAVLAARPFAREMHNTLARVAFQKDITDHPLLARREPTRHELLFVLTSDRGLCGSFNSNVLHRLEHYLLDHHERSDALHVVTMGRKAHAYLSKNRYAVEQNIEGLLDRPSYSRAVDLAEQLAARFVRSELDRVTLVFNEFRSAVQQRVVFRTLLPLDPPAAVRDGRSLVDYQYEPAKPQLLDRLIHRYLANQLFMIVLESVASEHGARMTAMDNASSNAGDMIGRLTLAYNKTRQASITKELMEIVGGAEALKSSA
jgi:F-type H+-transporting ATPase subunit gamma